MTAAIRRLPSASYASVERLFDAFDFQQAHFGSVLDGSLPGRVFVSGDADGGNGPASACIMPDEGFLYLGGRPSASFIEALSGVLHEGSATECIEAFWMHEGWAALVTALSPDGKSAIMNRRLYRLSPDSPLRTAGSAAADPRVVVEWKPGFLSARVELDGRVASECRGLVRQGHAEIDIETEESCRRQGLGRRVAQAFIAACVMRGVEPQWNCWDFREESCALAEALGLGLLREHRVFLWDKYL